MNFLINIKQVFRKYSFFLVPYLLLLAFCVILLLSFSKSEIHIWSNRHNTEFLDFFFSKITHLGNGVFVIALCILFLFYRIRYSLLLFSGFIISGLFVQLVKRFILPGMPRPNVYFKNIYNLHFVNGVQILHSFSFPSGHSATAFAMFLSLAIITKNNILQFMFFILACLVAYSRIYLSQHFLMDATAGSFIGVVTVFFCYYFLQQIKTNWIDQSIFSLKKKSSLLK